MSSAMPDAGLPKEYSCGIELSGAASCSIGLSGAASRGVNPTEADLRWAKLSDADSRGADPTEADTCEADVPEVDSAEIDLPGIESFAEVTSTNDVARERAAAGAPHGTAVRADVQTGGRGQRGHTWTSPKGGLYLSIVLRPKVPQHVMAGLPVACALGAADALRGLGITDLQIKWPNDLVVGDMGERKLGGLLTEAGWSADGPQPGIFAVCGIGINVKTPAVAHQSPHALQPAGIEDALPGVTVAPSLDDLAGLVRNGVVAAVDAWADAVRAARTAAMPLTGIMESYFDLLAYKNEQVALFDRGGRPYNAGILTGVDTWGRILIKIGKQEQPFDSAQVSIRPVL